MRNLQSIFFTVAFVCFTYFSVIAQPGGPRGANMSPEERAARQTSHLQAELELDEAQTASVGEINLKYANLMAKVRGELMGDREAMRAGMQKLRADQHEELKGVLSETQLEKLDQLQAERRPPGEAGPKRKRKRDKQEKDSSEDES